MSNLKQKGLSKLNQDTIFILKFNLTPGSQSSKANLQPESQILKFPKSDSISLKVVSLYQLQMETWYPLRKFQLIPTPENQSQFKVQLQDGAMPLLASVVWVFIVFTSN
ncbi:hypothetical protein WICPIJ_009734 [Wickerhamomyces pijperi]|uniref:Uncharacterized protein n=1 Tax=Wickerhamomyces pijperi TaxID=599730 RepID=A0A9P8TCT9_WICPI|nr:hypothetical protein WICPIJ_009734 [Wickerhamomyces pijperi]